MTTAIPAAELDARFSDPNASATPWERVEHTIDGAELFWISTVRSDGRPHVTPLPAVWVDGSLYFCTGAEEQKCVNLARNANCVLTTGNNAWKSGLDVVVEGTAVRVTDEKLLVHLAESWRSKYHGDWDFEVRDGMFRHDGGDAFVFAVAPTKVLSFAKGDFAQTRFRFTR
ncbi:MAG: pyridoxamine 5'-phosphate oxidase family protein [Chloroflexi bacterium]|jgi:general stress protein 26|nr:MAG: pyridoxamine 5'-phosphate oxidase family protein [Chloroflexota bacterium]